VINPDPITPGWRSVLPQPAGYLPERNASRFPGVRVSVRVAETCTSLAEASVGAMTTMVGKMKTKTNIETARARFHELSSCAALDPRTNAHLRPFFRPSR